MYMNSLLCIGLVCMFYCVVDACMMYLCFIVHVIVCTSLNFLWFPHIMYFVFFRGKECYVIVI